jgi:DNA primase
MGRIPQRFIDDLLTRIDIVQVIGSYVPLKKSGSRHVACCPFHSENTPSFTVSPDKQFYHCFGCGAHGTVLSFLLEYEHLDFIDAVEHLAETVGLEVPREGGEIRAERHDDLYGILEDAARLYKQALRENKQAIQYLKDRGLSGKIARDYGLGYAPAGWHHLINCFNKSKLDILTRAGLIKQNDQGQSLTRFRNRIMFPIRDRRGRVIGFGGRVLDDSLPKYLNSPDTALFHKGESLYGLFELRKAQGKPERVLLVEGYMDVLALAQNGIDFALATLGTATTRQHLEQIFRLTHEVVFCFDGDRAGREAGWRALQQLLPVFRDGLEARFMFLPQSDDPDSMIRREGKEAFLKHVMSAAPLADFLFTRLTEGLDMGDAASRARLSELAKPLLLTLPEGVFKELMYTEIAKRVGTSVKTLASPKKDDSIHRASNLRLKTHSPVRMAIAILLHEPELVQQMPPADLSALNLPGVALLIDILETLRCNPHLNSASLLERYRDTAHHQHLLQLMTWQPPGKDFDLRGEFQHAILSLNKKAMEQRADMLLRKGRNEILSPNERRELQDILGRKLGRTQLSTQKNDNSVL